MNQQEIKENMTQGTWLQDMGSPKSINKHSVICWMEDKYLDKHDSAANCLAITHAINNTYGKGINPESVHEMYNALTIVAKDLIELKLYDAANTIQSILNKATL